MAPGLIQTETVQQQQQRLTSISLNGAYEDRSFPNDSSPDALTLHLDLAQEPDELLGLVKSASSKLLDPDALADLSLGSLLHACWLLTALCFTPANVVYLELDPSNGLCKVSDTYQPGRSMLEYDPEDRLVDFICKLHALKPGQSTNPEEAIVVDEQAPASGKKFLTSTITYSPSDSNKSKMNHSFDPSSVAVEIIKRPARSGIAAVLRSPRSAISNDYATSLLHTFNQTLTLVRSSISKPVAELNFCSDLDITRIHSFTKEISPSSETLLHELCLDHAKQFPNAPAIASWDRNFTYRELDEAASKLAQYLAAIGVRPETFVLSCFEKSSWAIVARLAIMKAGAAYISIDATDPPGYLTSLINRVGSTIMLVSSGYEAQYQPLIQTVIPITNHMIDNLPPVIQPIHCGVQPGNACLILFTSGSTGQPKGIIQEHRSYATAIQDYNRLLRIGRHSRVFQFDDYAFDISNNDYLTALVAGGCCCVPTPEKTISGLIENVNKLQANMSFMTPTVAVRVHPHEIPCMQLLCLGGEPMSNDLLTRWAGKVQLVNQYGMGEAATFCCYNDGPKMGEHAVVGLPGSGAVWIASTASPEIPVPVGAVGEILIEGPHLSRGYLDDVCLKPGVGFLDKIPRWIADLHPSRASYTRIYRSGDLGRYTADGKVEHMGRKDTMLKMNGCRIECTEVEYVLRQSLSSTRDAIIVDLLGEIDGGEDPVLTAFVYIQCNPLNLHASASNEEMTFTPITEKYAGYELYEKMKADTEDVMPEYMFPGLFLLVDRIPRTKSNKTDRRKLHQLAQKYYMSSLG